MRPLTWEEQGRIVTPEDGPEWRRHMAGAVHVLSLGNGGYRVYLSGA